MCVHGYILLKYVHDNDIYNSCIYTIVIGFALLQDDLEPQKFQKILGLIGNFPSMICEVQHRSPKMRHFDDTL